ncbi:SDR family oxidoreductase [Slackia isoflavoniconvertens]|nr:SDR family oxidoreductase [Slackia isoflavoniconvertens]MBB3279915.1 NAD(P)-dependent dehydrogenase (short-subunit alcohol dehydrogenase family) [Slackia isoflavoniconvertens]
MESPIDLVIGFQRRRNTVSCCPMARTADPAEIANGILFLASDMASYCTGEPLALDGGQQIA